MSSFTSNLKLESTGNSDSAGGPLYRTTRPLVYEVGAKGSNARIEVPKGFITNLGSVPRIWILQYLYRDIVSPHGRWVAAPVLHDWLCNERFEGQQQLSGFSRFEADAIFRSALKVLGAPYHKRQTIYLAVRLRAILRGLLD